MAKKIVNTNQRPAQAAKPKQEAIADPTPAMDPTLPAWLSDFKIHAIIIGLLAFLFYINTAQNEYALDDTIVIVKNKDVYEGFAGLPHIMTHDAYDNYYALFNSSNQLAGGRYRPLSVATFAIEQQFLGTIPASKVDSVVANAGGGGPQEKKLIKDMHVHHFFGVLWFTLSMVVLLYFLRYVVFKKNPLMALLAAVIFVIHPIHTEVVANVKSRDEVLSLLFICLTYIFAFKYEEQSDKKEKRWMLVMGILSFVLAFLSKEYAVGMIILMPLAFYLFNKYSLSQSIKASLPYFVVMGLYMLLRLQIIAPMSKDSETDILNNPYALASHSEQLATKISTTFNYLRLLVFPHPLSADYSYNTIPYKDFTDIIVWISLAVHIWLFRMFFYYLKRRSVLCFAIGFYLVNLLLICNIIFNIGGTMGERLIYHSSVGFAIAVAYFLYLGMEKIKPAATGRMALAGLMVVLVVLCGFKVIERNENWTSDKTLFFHDINVAPNSVLVNADVASSLVNMAEGEKDSTKALDDIRKGIHYFDRAIDIDPAFVSGYLNRGMAFFKLKQPDSAYYNLCKVRDLYPRYPKLSEMFFNVGVNFYQQKRYREAISVWQATLQMDPNNTLARNALAVMAQQGMR